MFIESLRIQGFKSLADVTLTNLGTLNVFHGPNDAGKSNILEAVDLLCRLLPETLMSGEEGWTVNERILAPYTADTLFRRQNLPRREVRWEATVKITRDGLPVSFVLTLQDLVAKLSWPQEPPDDETQRSLAENCSFALLAADRHLSPEVLTDTTAIAELKGIPTRPENLKRRLFLASAGDDLRWREQFARLRSLLDKWFHVGQLDVAITTRPTVPRAPDDPLRYAPEVVARFLRPEGDFRIETVGSGVRQILLLLGQILFNPVHSVGIEEPEMNLSPEWQARLMDVFRDLVQPGAGGLDQMFITSHSLVFKPDSAYYYDVCYQDQATVVTPRPVEDRQKYFKILGLTQEAGEELGPYLNPQGQVTLPRRVIEDLGVQPYEPVFFVREGEYWRLRTKKEIIEQMKAEEQAYADNTQGCA